LIECDSIAGHYGTQIALEALNRYETPFLNTARDVSSFIESSKLTSTGILLDTFHMNIEEQSIEETISNYISKIVHFHIADSNRWPPGYGHLKIENLLGLLKESGYDGWVSAETLPMPSSIEAVRDTSKFLRLHHFMRG
jgi:sugar phosphate isomerase/epimerase